MIDEPSTINLGGSSIAKMIYEGDANILGLGDSIMEGYAGTTDENAQSNWPSGIAKEWRPANWVGWGGQRASSASGENIRTYFSSPWTNGDHNDISPTGTILDGGGVGIVPHPWVRSWQFSTNYANTSSIERWQFNEDDGAFRGFGAGDWFNNRTNLKARIVYWRSPNSITDAEIAVKRGATTYHTGTYDFSGSGSLQYFDIPIENTTGDIELNIKCGAGDETGKFCHLVDIHWFVDGGSGFSFNKFLSNGGATVKNLLSSKVGDVSYNASGYISDENFNRYAEIYNTPNIYIIAIGVNDSGPVIATQGWRDQLKLAIDRCHNASNALGVKPKILLLSNYSDTTSNFTVAHAQSHYDSMVEVQSQGTSNVSSNDIAVISTHHLLNKRSLQSLETSDKYLSDGIHPTMRGTRNIMNLAWQAIKVAATVVSDIESTINAIKLKTDNLPDKLATDENGYVKLQPIDGDDSEKVLTKMSLIVGGDTDIEGDTLIAKRKSGATVGTTTYTSTHGKKTGTVD